jgi:hypothetical protein
MEPISFATVLLPLVMGLQPVDLVVTDRVATVEVLLDGQEVARLQGPPWSIEADLGDDLVPHRLEAVAFDGSGLEIGRARQWINRSRSVGAAETAMALSVEVADRSSLGSTRVLASDGQSLAVSLIEHPPASVIVVFDREAEEAWRAMRFRTGSTKPPATYDPTGEAPMRGLRSDDRQAVAPLSGTTTLHVLASVPSADLEFPMSLPMVAPDGDAILGIPLKIPPAATDSEQTLADAVAMAGRLVAGRDHRRAVLLILGDGSDDASTFTASQVREYLAALGVPLVVWSPETRTVRNSPWGEVERVANRRQLDGAVKQLREILDHQVVVSLDEAPLPQAIAVADGVEGVRIAGR